MPDSAFVVHLIDLPGLGSRALQDALVAEGYVVATLAADQIDLLVPTSDHPDTIILYLAREGSPGMALCHHLRSAFPRCAICLVHEGLGVWEESIALELGADALVLWPTDVRRAVAQVRAFERLKGRNPSPRVPHLQLLPGSRTVRAHGSTVYLTDAEFDLLSLLAKQAGQAVSREAICRQMRGLAHQQSDRTIDLRIARIRHKLGDNPHDPEFIRTVRGEGYLLMVGEA